METNSKGKPVNLIYLFLGLIFLSCSPENDKIETLFGEEGNSQKEEIKNGTLTYNGYTYKTVVIGDQEWLAENLRTTSYNDGTSIANITDNTAWAGTNNGAMCAFNNDQNNVSIYGYLYNWHAVNTGKLAPAGWRVPTDNDWVLLFDHLGGLNESGGKLKEVGTTHWGSPNVGATNEVNFSSLPGGLRGWDSGWFLYTGNLASFWSSTSANTPDGDAWSYFLNYDQKTVLRSANRFRYGYSVRLVMNRGAQVNNPPTEPSLPLPVNESISQSISLSLGWSCSDPDGDSLTYDVYLGTNSSPTTLVSANQTAKNFSPAGLTTNTTYYWKIVAKDSRGGTTTGPVWNFKTELANNPPSIPSNPSPPSDLTTLQPTTVSLSWSCSDPDGDALTYDIYFGTNSSPTTIVSANQTAKNYSPSGLTTNTIYYWKIVAKDTRGGTTAGSVWNFKTEPGNNPPAMPSNPSPASNLTTLQPTTVSLIWSCSDPDGDALTYDVYFGTNSSPTTIVSANQTAKNFTPTGLTNNTIYYWKIVAKDSRGESTTGVVWNFKTELSPNNPPVTPSNPSPASNLTTLQPITVSLSWSCSDPDGDAVTYNVYFGTNSSPTTIVSANQTAKNFLPAGLTTNTIYYWKIVAKDSRGGSTTGPVWQFKTELPPNNPPVAPSNPSPASNLISLQPTTVSLSWSCSDPDGDALTYDVYFGTNSSPTTIVSANQTAKNFLPAGLTTNTIYYWKIVANDSKGATTTGPVWNFKTELPPNNPPVSPSNPSPASNLTTLQPITVSLSWSCSDPDGDAVTYDVYFGTSSSPTTIVSANQTAKTFTPSGLTNNTIYYWKIVAKDSRGGSTTGPVWQFKTELPPNNPPVTPSNPSPPSYLMLLQPTTVSLSWSCSDPDGDALTYDVYFGTSSTPTTIVSANQTTKTFTPTGLTNNTVYYWKIVAKDSKGGATTGPVWNFKTELPPNHPPVAPSNPSPASNLTTMQPTTVSLSWSCSDQDGDALTYDVYIGTSSSPNVIVSTNQSSKNYSTSELSLNTTYYWKVVAKDGKGGTTTGAVWQFKTVLNYDFTFDGHLYKTVVIGTQVWTVENLQTTKYNDGTSIDKITDNTDWVNLTSGAFCAYNNTESRVSTYGYLYNFYAVNTGKLAPTTGGWRVPTDADWDKLTNYVGGSLTAGTKLKAKTGWNGSGNGTDNYGFSALPGGYRGVGLGIFYSSGNDGRWWSSASSGSNDAWYRSMYYTLFDVFRSYDSYKSGFSVRLVRDK